MVLGGTKATGLAVMDSTVQRRSTKSSFEVQDSAQMRRAMFKCFMA